MGFLKKLKKAGKSSKGGSKKKAAASKKTGGGGGSAPAAAAAPTASAPAPATGTGKGSSAAADSGRTDEPLVGGQRVNSNGNANAQKQKQKKKSGGKPTLKSPHRGIKNHMNQRHRPQAQAKAATTTVPTMDLVPDLITDLETAPTASGDAAARALRMLFSLSEHGGGGGGDDGPNNGNHSSENRIAMVRADGGRLVPVLLSFLRRCERGSSEQYLALLVLNNISIPSDNKRLVAMDYGGAHLLSRLLCIDPSCHLMAIILVNLSFADADLRRELVAPSSPVQLVDALSYTLLMSTLTPEEHEGRPPLIDPDDHNIKFMGKTGGEEINLSPRKLLAAAMTEDRKYRPTLTDLDYNSGAAAGGASASAGVGADGASTGLALFDSNNLMYAETARWCLCALKNLTRPSKDPLAAHALMDTAIVPLILKAVAVGSGSGSSDGATDVNVNGSAAASTADKEDDGPFGGDSCGAPCGGWDQNEGIGSENVNPNVTNDPSTWDANSLQDAALFTLLNMSAIPAARPYLRELDSTKPLAQIIKAATTRLGSGSVTADEQKQKQLAFQCLKARMAVAFLLASEGHFGQSRATSETTAYYARTERSAMLTNKSEAILIVELLANVLHQRAKDGAGGYSAATFSIKVVLCAIRCLLTSAENQATLATHVGVQLNALLLIALAQHAIRRAPAIDSEAAEHASFSLYLLSNSGFKNPFLPMPYSFGSQADKVLTSYLQTPNVTPAGQHAASQLLLRMKYLVFQGEIEDEGDSGIQSSDFELSFEIKRDLESIVVETRSPGAKPREDIFDRPILRSRAPKKGMEKAPWDNASSVSPFPNALLAIQQMSFGSTKVRHLGSIDDVFIANSIAKCAGGEKSESYNYWWKWQDEIDAPPDPSSAAVNGSTRSTQRSSSSKGGVMSSFLSRATSGGEDTEPISIFGFTCCAADTV